MITYFGYSECFAHSILFSKCFPPVIHHPNAVIKKLKFSSPQIPFWIGSKHITMAKMKAPQQAVFIPFPAMVCKWPFGMLSVASIGAPQMDACFLFTGTKSEDIASKGCIFRLRSYPRPAHDMYNGYCAKRVEIPQKCIDRKLMIWGASFKEERWYLWMVYVCHISFKYHNLTAVTKT